MTSTSRTGASTQQRPSCRFITSSRSRSRFRSWRGSSAPADSSRSTSSTSTSWTSGRRAGGSSGGRSSAWRHRRIRARWLKRCAGTSTESSGSTTCSTGHSTSGRRRAARISIAGTSTSSCGPRRRRSSQAVTCPPPACALAVGGENALEEPREALLEVFEPQLREPLPAVEALTDQSSLAQDLEVVAGGGLAHRQVEGPACLCLVGGIQLANDLETHRVAEGVEHRLERDVLRGGLRQENRTF